MTRGQSWQLGWWWLPISMAVVVAVTMVVIALWLHTSGDLDAQVARATSAGVYQDLSRLGPEDARAADDAEVFRRIVAVCNGLDVWSLTGDWSRLMDPFSAPPTELEGWMDPTRGILDPLLDGLSGEATWPVRVARAVRGPGPLDLEELIWDDRSDLQHLLLLRSVQGTDPAQHARHVAQLARTAIIPGLSGHLRSLLLARDWQIHVLRYRDSIDPRQFAIESMALAATLDQRLHAVLMTQPALQDAILRRPPAEHLLAVNVGLPKIMVWPLAQRVFHRAGRGRILARSIDVAMWVSTNGLPRTIAEVRSAVPSLPRLSMTNGIGELYGEVVDGGFPTQTGQRNTFAHQVIESHLFIITGLRLLAADLAGRPWPTDPGDPAGASLRPVLRDGAIIGAYGLGVDGLDQGGDRRLDWVWPLRAQLGKPKAGDPIPESGSP